jgi:hypothetical protein
VPALHAELLLRLGALPLTDDDALDDELRPSSEWADLFDIEIVHPAGWDAADFEHDFYVKRISREEFLDRAARSTTRPLRGP